MRPTKLELIWSGAVALLAGTALAGPRVVMSANSEHFPTVNLSVHVTDRDGGTVNFLTAKDFKVFEDLAEVPVQSAVQQRVTGGKVDLTFVFDTTGSMGDELAGLLVRANRFADMLAQSGLDWQVSLVPFGDAVGDAFPPTHDIAVFKKALAGLGAVGGGDEPENQLEALMAATHVPTRPGAQRVFILVTDATFHAHDSVTPLRADDVVNALAEASVQLVVVGPDIDEYQWMARSLQGTFFDKNSGEFDGLVSQLGGALAPSYVVTYTTPRARLDGTRRSVTLTAKSAGGTGEDASQYVAPTLVQGSSRAEALKGEESQFSPRAAIDGKADTQWVPDGTSADEWLTLTFDAPRKVSSVTVAPAHDERFSVPRDLELLFDGATRRLVTMDGTREAQTLAVEPPVTARVVRLAVRSSKPENRPVAIAELSVADGRGLVMDLARLRRTTKQLSEAAALNERGEKAYHRGKLEVSLALYQAAVEKAPELAQAWSNLGLSYWKLKRYSEAVSADRQAIALGRQQSMPQVVASSYYTVGRTFEEQGELKQALQSYWWANQAVPKETYQVAIARLSRKLSEDAP